MLIVTIFQCAQAACSDSPGLTKFLSSACSRLRAIESKTGAGERRTGANLNLFAAGINDQLCLEECLILVMVEVQPHAEKTLRLQGLGSTQTPPTPSYPLLPSPTTSYHLLPPPTTSYLPPPPTASYHLLPPPGAWSREETHSAKSVQN